MKIDLTNKKRKEIETKIKALLKELDPVAHIVCLSWGKPDRYFIGAGPSVEMIYLHEEIGRNIEILKGEKII